MLIDRGAIARRVAELGAEIGATSGPDPLLVVGILKGAFVFTADLVRAIPVPVEVDFMAVSSYGAATRSSGVVRIVKDLDESLAGRDVLVVEDIVDTGLTLQYLQRSLRQRGPRRLRTAVLLDKPSRRVVEAAVDFVGFSIPDRYVVGYGLDADQQHRQHPDILCADDPETEG
ncbi:MAG: hypoxanthine phosphoribosyltransferase [Firmicutes bacterium]|nr:hypoxanthine phosphoribosyltransferase [Bacillota bacterium]